MYVDAAILGMAQRKQVDPARHRMARMRRPHQHVFNCRSSVDFDVL